MAAATPSPIVTIELFDDSNFKTSITPQMTPKNLLKLTARKRGLTQIECFGFQVPRSSLTSAGSQPILNASQPAGDAKEEDWVFLLDDVAIVEQVALKPKFKIMMAMKYAYVDIKKDWSDEKTIAILMGEMSSKFRALQTNSSNLKDDVVIQLVALQVHCKNVINPGASYIDDARSMVPAWMAASVTDEFLEGCLQQVKNLTSVNYTEASKKFLAQVRTLYPQWYSVKFEALHGEQSMTLTAATEGMYISQVSQQPLYLSYKMLSRWHFAPEEDHLLTGSSSKASVMKTGSSTKADDFDKQSLYSVAESAFTPPAAASGTMKRISMSGRSQASSPEPMADSPTKDKKMSKEAGKTLGRFSMGRRTAPTSKLSISEIANGYSGIKGNNRYQLNLSFNQDYLYPIELIVLSPLTGDMRLKELIEHFSGKYSKTDLDAEDEEELLDDPSKANGAVLTCTANCDYEAKGEEELMFLTGEVITIVKKLNNGFYIGNCQNIEGVFRGTMVTFQRRDAQQVKKKVNLLTQIVKVKAVTAVEVVILNFLDDTRKSLKITDKTTGQQLIRMMAEKMDLSDCDFFGVAVVSDNGERWLLGNVPVVNQGIAGAKLYFKVRAQFYDSSDLSDKQMCYLNYLQVKQFVLSGLDPLKEDEVIEFASLQLQAAYGDHDPEKHKIGTIGNVLQYLPPIHQKFTMTRSDNWWQKKLLAAHVQHKGLTKTEAEKAYMSTSQRLPHSGYTVYSIASPENICLGISRDFIAILDKTTKNIIEKYSSDMREFSYSNNSLNLELKFNIDGNIKKHSFMSLQTPDIMEVLNIQTIAETRNNMRKTCRKVRDKFTLMGMTIELDGDVVDRYLKDPEYFAQYLRNGVALRILLDALDKPLPTSGPLSQPTSILGGDSPSSELRAYSCMEKIQDFLNHARDVVGMQDSDLFLPEELYNYNFTNFQIVLDSLIAFFDMPAVSAKLNAVNEYMKVNKIRGKGAASDKPAMTQEDFMKKVMDELMMTEVNYSKDMDTVYTMWYKPLEELVKRTPQTDQKTIEQDVFEMFGNMNELSAFHQMISAKLVECGTNIEKVGEIGVLFSSNADKFIQLYEKYCSNHAEPADRMPDISAHQELQAIIGTSADPQASQLAMRNLSSQLIKPVQRIMRYHLLLKELVRYTLENHPGYGQLDNGLNRMKEVASAVNEIKRRKENQRTLNELQERIESYEGPPIQAFGQLLQDGNMVMVEKAGYNPKKITPATQKENTLHFFLFEEVILFCKENTKKKAGANAIGLKFKGMVPILMVVTKDQVQDLTGDELKFAWEFTRMDTQKTYIMTNTTYEEKDRWVQQVTECVEKAASKPAGEQGKGLDWKKFKAGDASAVQGDAAIKKNNSAFQFTVKAKFGGKKSESDAAVSTPMSVTHQAIPPSMQAAIDAAKQDAEQKHLSDQVSQILKQLEEDKVVMDKVVQENQALNQQLAAEVANVQSLKEELELVKQKNSQYEALLQTIAKTRPEYAIASTAKIAEQDDQAQALNKLMDDTRLNQ